MPATQLKMLRYMQSSDPDGNGIDNNGELGESPEVSPQPAPQQPSQPPPPLSARQQLAEAAKIPIPVPVRGATLSQQTSILPVVAASKQQQQQQSRRRTRSPPTPSEQTQQQIWEESSINSMFAESVPATARKQRTNHGRYESPVAQQHQIASYRGNEEPDRGRRRMVPSAAAGDDAYEDRALYGSPSRQVPVLKHPKYALRDSRAATIRPSADRLSLGNYEEVAGGTSAHQSAFYHDAETPLARSPRKVRREDESDALSQDDEATMQQTPRPHHSPPRRPPPLPPSGAPQKRGLLESSALRAGGGGGSRRDRKMGRKRRNSLDYDDSMLHSMSYSDLRVEPFDHDPTRVVTQAATPPKLSLEDRLVQHKNKDGNSQHRFFTEMSMREWDDCGDWFLTQFSELSNRIREKRQVKRKKVAEFETEIAEREEMVRAKMESIDRTLDKLKDDGEGMMRGKAAGM